MIFQFDRWRDSNSRKQSNPHLQLQNHHSSGNFSFLLWPDVKDAGRYQCEVFRDDQVFAQVTVLTVLKGKNHIKMHLWIYKLSLNSEYLMHKLWRNMKKAIAVSVIVSVIQRSEYTHSIQTHALGNCNTWACFHNYTDSTQNLINGKQHSPAYHCLSIHFHALNHLSLTLSLSFLVLSCFSFLIMSFPFKDPLSVSHTLI